MWLYVYVAMYGSELQQLNQLALYILADNIYNGLNSVI